jgi:hypothetical protein
MNKRSSSDRKSRLDIRILAVHEAIQKFTWCKIQIQKIVLHIFS